MSEKERPQGVFDWLKNGSPEKSTNNEISKSKSSNKWLFVFVVLIISFVVWDKKNHSSVATQNTPVFTQEKPKEHAEFKGTLMDKWANTPNAFYEELVNGRSQFTDKQELIEANKIRQIITNTDGTLLAENIWHKNNENWRCSSATLSYSSAIDMDSIQVVFRWPYRFEDGDAISKSMSAATKMLLPSGATLETIKHGNKTIFKIE